MVVRAGKPVAAGLDQVARMSRGERARLVRQLSAQSPAFRAMRTRIALSRALAFGSALALATAVITLVNGGAQWWVASLIFVGLGGFASNSVVLADQRFDLLLAVLGAHRTDVLHGRLVTETIYGDEITDEHHVVPSEANRADVGAPLSQPAGRSGCLLES